MWPKVLAQLIEFLPHAARLLPMADRFMQSRAANDDALRRAIEELRTEVAGHSAGSSESLYRQMNEQVERLSTLSTDMRAVRSSMEEAEGRMLRIERRQQSFAKVLVTLLLLQILLLGLVIFILLRH